MSGRRSAGVQLDQDVLDQMRRVARRPETAERLFALLEADRRAKLARAAAMGDRDDQVGAA